MRRMAWRWARVPIRWRETTQRTRVMIGGERSTAQILYFFSTACRYCLASMPQLQQIAGGRGTSELVGVGSLLR